MIAEHLPVEQWQTRGKKNERERGRRGRREGQEERERGGGKKVTKFYTFS